MRTLFTFFLCTIFSYWEASAQKVVLNLTPVEKPSLETDYRYSQVLDHRLRKSLIGEVFERAGHTLPVTVEGGVEASAFQFFSESILAPDSAESDIQVRILELELTEKFNPETKLYEGDMRLGLGYFVVGSFDPVHLLDYAGSIQYQRSGFRMEQIEGILNKLFRNSLVYFDSWIKSQALNTRALAKAFRLDIIDQHRESTADKVYYEPGRPLVWDDFKARPRPNSRNNATIFSSFSLEGISLMDSGSVVQTLELQVYMLPMQSWVKKPSNYGLNHEQRHFDVVRIVADRLIYRLENKDLSLDFYQSQINEAYLDAYREMNRLQDLYETGTNHGLNPEAQERWNGWIDDALGGDWSRIEDLLSSAPTK